MNESGGWMDGVCEIRSGSGSVWPSLCRLPCLSMGGGNRTQLFLADMAGTSFNVLSDKQFVFWQVGFGLSVHVASGQRWVSKSFWGLRLCEMRQNPFPELFNDFYRLSRAVQGKKNHNQNIIQTKDDNRTSIYNWRLYLILAHTAWAVHIMSSNSNTPCDASLSRPPKVLQCGHQLHSMLEYAKPESFACKYSIEKH